MLHTILPGWTTSEIQGPERVGVFVSRLFSSRTQPAAGFGRGTGLARDSSGEATSSPGDARDSSSGPFASAYAAHEADVVRVCRRLLGGREEARDAPQEVFLRARQAYSGYDPGRPFRPWLVRIAGNHCIDVLRRQALQQRIFADADPDETAAVGELGSSPLAGVLARERRDLVGRAIANLPLKYRLPLALRYFSELDYDAIAEALDVSRNQVGTLLYRAKGLLRKEIEEGVERPRGGQG